QPKQVSADSFHQQRQHHRCHHF
ncbi:hypothetical protein D043_2471B, partial [Vibrio parahaemolyticus EKP-021]